MEMTTSCSSKKRKKNMSGEFRAGERNDYFSTGWWELDEKMTLLRHLWPAIQSLFSCWNHPFARWIGGSLTFYTHTQHRQKKNERHEFACFLYKSTLPSTPGEGNCYIFETLRVECENANSKNKGSFYLK